MISESSLVKAAFMYLLRRHLNGDFLSYDGVRWR